MSLLGILHPRFQASLPSHDWRWGRDILIFLERGIMRGNGQLFVAIVVCFTRKLTTFKLNCL